MKVSRSRVGREGVARGERHERRRLEMQHTPFLEALHAADFEQMRRQVEPDFDALEAAAQRLKESPTMVNLRHFKEVIRQMLTKVLESAYVVEEVRAFNRRGRQTVSMLVRTIDRELDELGRLILAKAQDTLAIAAKIDDIRGLIFDYLR